MASGGSKLKVSNLHYDVTEDTLKEIFTKNGWYVRSCKIIWDRHDRSTGEAEIVFENPRGAQEAKTQMDGQEIEGQKV